MGSNLVAVTYSNFTLENINVLVTPAKKITIIQTEKKITKKKIKNQNKEHTDGKSVVLWDDSKVKHLNEWKMTKKIKDFKVYVQGDTVV